MKIKPELQCVGGVTPMEAKKFNHGNCNNNQKRPLGKIYCTPTQSPKRVIKVLQQNKFKIYPLSMSSYQSFIRPT
jgi:hypothetical protein